MKMKMKLNSLTIGNKFQYVPFIIYADFEAITEKNKKCDVNESKDNSNVSYTKACQTHVDCGYGYKVVCHYD